MDDDVHGRRAAIYATERKRLPPSFYWGLTAALAIHVGGAYYLLQTHFDRALPEPPIVTSDPTTTITMDRPAKPDKPAPTNVVRVHDPVQVTDKTETAPIIPQKSTSDTIDDPTKPPVLPTISGGEVKDIGGEGQGVITAARWSRFPDGNALAEYYPPKAADAEIEGQATVQCAVLDSSGRVSCAVVSETPGNYGFGAATVRMVQDKGRVDTTQGNATKGAVLRQTVAWKLN